MIPTKINWLKVMMRMMKMLVLMMLIMKMVHSTNIKKVVSLDMSKDIDQNQGSDDETNQEHQAQSSMVIHDEDVDYQNEPNIDILQKLSLNSPKNNGHLSKLKEDVSADDDRESDMEIDDETEDKIASLPTFSNNGVHDKRSSISSTNSSHGAHSRTSSS